MKVVKSTLSVVLVVLICLPMFCFNLSAKIALDTNSLKTLINAETVHPQKTGYPELDKLLDNIIAPVKDSDTYTKIVKFYDWCVYNVLYSWDGYTQQTAPAYDKFGLDYDLEKDPYVKTPYPKDMINRAYHSLTAKTGVCYDYAILFTVMARYVGIECYVHTGILRVNSWTGHHGWSEMILNGKGYIFDPQQDNREVYTLGGSDCHVHFGIPTPHSRWADEEPANSIRDSQLLPMTEDQFDRATVSVVSSRSGNVEGCTEPKGSIITLKSDTPGKKVERWYCDGELVSESPEYSFTLTEDKKVFAVFEGDVFTDVKNTWYLNSVLYAYEHGYMNGVSPYEFLPNGNITRAMAVTILAAIDGADLSAYTASTFKDVPAGKWYSKSVEWAYANGYIVGVGDGNFAPNQDVTRETLAQLLFTYSDLKGYDVSERADMSAYTDASRISGWAEDAVSWAIAYGLISGTSVMTVSPTETATRAQSAVIFNNYIESYVANHATVDVVSSRSGNIEDCMGSIGSTITLKSDTAEKNVERWYCDGVLVSESPEYSFTLTDDTTVYAVFEGDVFTDVKNAWYLDSVLYICEQGFMNGVSPYEFAPNGNVTRAMIVTILAAIDGADLSAYTASTFKDVPADKWYSSSVEWAYENGYTVGVGDGNFALTET